MNREEIIKKAQGQVNCCTPLYIEGRDVKIKELGRLNSNQAESLRITMLEEEKKGKRIEEELNKWKDEWQEQVQKAIDEGYARTLQTIQLTKAKELIENIIRVTWGEGWNYSLDWKVKAEQFLKEIEK